MATTPTQRKKPGPKPAGGKPRVQVSTWTDHDTAEQIHAWTTASAKIFPDWTTGRTLELMTRICRLSPTIPVARRSNKKAGRASTPNPAIPITSAPSKSQNLSPVNPT